MQTHVSNHFHGLKLYSSKRSNLKNGVPIALLICHSLQTGRSDFNLIDLLVLSYAVPSGTNGQEGAHP